jgi:hypothetical protein
MVAKILAPGVWVGHRPRADVRYVAFDIDAGSPYLGLACLQQLEAELERVGLPTVRIRSSHRGGIHLYGLLPAAVHREEAHWIARAIATRLGWGIKAGQLEVFPSTSRYSHGTNPKQFARCQGLRLPGQEGSALWAGGRWLEEPLAIWHELGAALVMAETSVAFTQLQREAQALREQHRSPSWFGRRVAAGSTSTVGTIRHNIRWTGPAQSNELLGRLTNVAYMAGHTTAEQLAQAVEQLALGAPGFSQWASDHTRADLRAWCLRWARSCIRKPPEVSRCPSNDPGRNERLARQARVAVIEGAIRAARTAGAEAIQWSERVAATFLGIARSTFRKLKRLWLIRVTAEVYAAPRPAGTDPSQQGLAVSGPSGRKPRLFSRKIRSLDSVPPVAPAETFPCGVPVPTTTDPPSVARQGTASTWARILQLAQGCGPDQSAAANAWVDGQYRYTRLPSGYLVKDSLATAPLR